MSAAAVRVSVSIVSHLQADLVGALLHDLVVHCQAVAIEVLLTVNLPEPLPFDAAQFGFPVVLIHNPQPLGFGANHNQAFARARGEYFCVVNPDIRLNHDPFTALLAGLFDTTVGVVAPRVVNGAGQPEDSARRFPTPGAIVLKALGLGRGSQYVVADQPFYPDWAGGMFLLFRAPVFAQMGGFDVRYFLYYEDVDLCARLRLAGLRVLVTPHASVVHAARRDSHRSGRYFRWHLASMLRFFGSPVFWKVRWRRAAGT
jgi:hypothetical protein